MEAANLAPVKQEKRQTFHSRCLPKILMEAAAEKTASGTLLMGIDIVK